MEKLYIVNKNKTGADCGSDHELLIAKFRLKLNKVWKTTRAFRYDLNQIPYDYAVEVTNRFQGLDLIESLENCGQKFHDIVKAKVKMISTNTNAKRQNGYLRRTYK